jgi:hypothetical protein
MKIANVLNIRNVLGIVIALVSQHAFGQHKTERPMASQQVSKDTVELTTDGLKVTQSGKNNQIEVSQSGGSTSVSSHGKTTIIDQNRNRIVHHATDADSSHTAKITQSGSGNNVVIRQSGGVNRVQVRQSSEKKKDE